MNGDGRQGGSYLSRFTVHDFWYPERLPARLDAAQAARGQVAFVEAEVREVRQVAQHGLEPAVAREQRAHARVGELRGVEGEHRQVLRSAGRGDGAEDALREILAEEEAAAEAASPEGRGVKGEKDDRMPFLWSR